MEMIRDALSPERLENMRKLLEREDEAVLETSRAAELGDALKLKREDEEERRDRKKWK